MDAGVAAAVDGGEPFLQFVAVAEGFFDGGHALGGEGLVEEGFEFGVGEVGGIVYLRYAREESTSWWFCKDSCAMPEVFSLGKVRGKRRR